MLDISAPHTSSKFPIAGAGKGVALKSEADPQHSASTGGARDICTLAPSNFQLEDAVITPAEDPAPTNNLPQITPHDN
jgi:hypothetical protein